MTDQQTSQDLVDHYLTSLRNQLWQVPLAARDEFMNEISEHVAEGRSKLSAEDVQGLRALLEHLGSPTELAREIIEGQREQRRQLSASKRIRKLVRPTCALLVVGLLLGALIWWTRYQPLRTSPLWQTGPSLSNSKGKRVSEINASTSELPGQVPIWNMPPGTSTVHIAVSIENAGSYPIKSTGVQSPVRGWQSFGPARVGFGRVEGGRCCRSS